MQNNIFVRWIKNAGLALSLLIIAGTTQSALAAQAINGKWKPTDGKAIITNAKCGQKMCGKISKILTANGQNAKDVRNPDATKRDRPLLGLSILTGLIDEGDSWSGNIYDPQRGMVFTATIKRSSANKLSVTGCYGMFCQTQIWTRSS